MPTVPHVDYCLVCDDLRLEVGNKATILGFYGVLPRVKILLQEWGKPIARLVFLISTHGSSDPTYDAQIRLINPDGSELLLSPVIVGESARTSTDNSSIAFGLQPVIFAQQGVHQFHLLISNAKVFESTFLVGTQKPNTASVGRNEMCPCGSGKKFKKCHGLNP